MNNQSNYIRYGAFLQAINDTFAQNRRTAKAALTREVLGIISLKQRIIIEFFS